MGLLRDPFPETRRDALLERGTRRPRRRGPSGRRGLGVWIAFVLLALLAAALYFGPHCTIYRMRSAIEHKDARALSSYVDFPSLRESLKAQMLVMLDRATGAAKDTPFAALGKALVVGVANTMVDAMVTPAGVLAMMEAGKVRPPTNPATTPGGGSATQSPNGQQPAPDVPPAAPEPSSQPPDYKLEYVDFSTVRITAPQASSGAFLLHRRNLFQWRLAAVELPVQDSNGAGMKP